MHRQQHTKGGSLRIALGSLDVAWEDKRANLERCRAASRRAREHGAGFVAFPEMTTTGFTMNAAAVAEPAAAAPTVRAFAGIARDAGIAIGFGVVLTGRARPTNSCVIVNAAGVEAARYAKVHPFSAAREDEAYEGGSELAVANIGSVRIGLTVCYDLRFPELYAALAPRCDAVLVIANWPAKRIDHWHALLKARSIEGQCYVIGVNRTGADPNGHRYPRSSCVIDPRGTVLEPLRTEGELDVFDVDAATVAEWRAAFPVAADRRPRLYRSFARADEAADLAREAGGRDS
jgi:omega-amidase